MFHDYDTIYDYASVIPRMAEVKEGHAALLEPNDLVMFVARNTGLLVVGEVIMSRSAFTVNGIEMGHRDKGRNVVTVDGFYFIPEPDITYFEQFSISHKRAASYIGWPVQFLGADKQWYEGIIKAVFTVTGAEVDSVPEVSIILEDDESKHRLAPLIPVLVVAPKPE